MFPFLDSSFSLISLSDFFFFCLLSQFFWMFLWVVFCAPSFTHYEHIFWVFSVFIKSVSSESSLIRIWPWSRMLFELFFFQENCCLNLAKESLEDLDDLSLSWEREFLKTNTSSLCWLILKWCFNLFFKTSVWFDLHWKMKSLNKVVCWLFIFLFFFLDWDLFNGYVISFMKGTGRGLGEA